MRIVVALGGNALLERGASPSAQNQRRNVRIAVQALAPIARDHQLVITHGNGPQVGLLALQAADDATGDRYPLDILDAETQGQIGYLIEQELRNVLGGQRECATLLTQIEVDPKDPAFEKPTKPIGPEYGQLEASALEQERGWRFGRDGERYRRVVPSPRPKRIIGMNVIKILVEHEVITICAGGGGIPAVANEDGHLSGVEGVIDKDFASALLARELGAQAILMLTDVDSVYTHWNQPQARRIRAISPQAVRKFSFADGSMGPKVAAACDFVESTGGLAAIGALKDACALLAGSGGTRVSDAATRTEYWG